MINAIQWFQEHGFTFDDKITIQDVMQLQDDAITEGERKGVLKGLREAVEICGECFLAENSAKLIQSRINELEKKGSE